jgi:tRNA1(Val) A37 N6-methylase TrmN6
LLKGSEDFLIAAYKLIKNKGKFSLIHRYPHTHTHSLTARDSLASKCEVTEGSKIIAKTDNVTALIQLGGGD